MNLFFATLQIFNPEKIEFLDLVTYKLPKCDPLTSVTAEDKISNPHLIVM